jgi:hypothetical protein
MGQRYGIKIHDSNFPDPPARTRWVTYNDGMTVGLMHLFVDTASAQTYADTLAQSAPSNITYEVAGTIDGS